MARTVSEGLCGIPYKRNITDAFLLASLILFTLIIVFFNCTQPGYLDDDSVAYAQTAKLVADSNRWLAFDDPTYGGKFYYHFPLVIWVSALIFKAFGVSVITASIFSLVSCLGCVISLFFFGKLIKDKWVGFFAATVFLLINFTPRLARQCRMDMPLTFFIILSMYFFSKAVMGRKINYLLFGLFTGLAIMAKDIFGLAPLAIGVIFLLITRKSREFLNPYFLLSLILAFVPVVSWIILEQHLCGETIFSKWLNWNFLHLLKSPAFNTPPYYYPLEIIKKYFYFLPLVIYGAYLSVRKFLHRESPVPLLILIWLIFIPLAFSFGRQKLHYFIYSMYPAFGLLCGLALEELLSERMRLRVFYILIFCICAFGAVELFTPLKITKTYFLDTVAIAPVIDNILEGAREYDFYTFSGQDDTALIFYSKRLKKTTRLKDNPQLIAKLNEKNSLRRRFCLFNKQDFQLVKPALTKEWHIILKHNDKILIADRQD